MSQDKAVKITKTGNQYWQYLLFLLLISLMFIVLVIVGLSLWNVFKLRHQVNVGLSQLAQQITADHQQIAGLQDQLSVTQEQLQQQTKAFQQWHDTVQKGQEYSQVLNAQYWVQQATDSLLLTNDLPRTLRLLQQARQQLSPIIHSQITSLQKALDQDFVTLQNVPWVDAEVLYQNLLIIQQQVKDLPLVRVPQQNAIIHPVPVIMSASGWERGWQSFKDALRQMIVIYHAPSANTPPSWITPDQAPYIHQNIIAMLNGAMWAVLYRNNSIYQANLQQARLWIQQYGDVNATFTKTVLSQLQALQLIVLHPTKTLVLVSPAAFRDYLKTM